MESQKDPIIPLWAGNSVVNYIGGAPWGSDGGPDCQNNENGTTMNSKMVPGTLNNCPKNNKHHSVTLKTLGKKCDSGPLFLTVPKQ